ncbi:MAG: hypothetical protein LBB93_04825 [Elusimicrobiota bacterium]|jgi:hypothetical protein|nr:hypothetical protein [Elusimicrobiota bacterium]
MKRIKPIAAVVLVFILFSLGHSKQIAVENISIEIPDSWTIMEVSEPTLILAEAPVTGNFSTVVSLSKEPMTAKGNAQEQKELSIKNLQSIFTSIKLVESKDNYWIYEDLVSENGTAIKQIQFFYVKDNNVYILTFSSAQYAFDSLKPVFDKIEQSFVLK